MPIKNAIGRSQQQGGRRFQSKTPALFFSNSYQSNETFMEDLVHFQLEDTTIHWSKEEIPDLFLFFLKQSQSEKEKLCFEWNSPWNSQSGEITTKELNEL